MLAQGLRPACCILDPNLVNLLDVVFLICSSVRPMDVVPLSGLPVLPHHSSACLLLQIVGPLNTICGKHFDSGETCF